MDLAAEEVAALPVGRGGDRGAAGPGEGLATSAIEGERLDVNAVRSSVARHLGLPSAGLRAPPRLGIAGELTGKKRDRVFAYDRYLAILSEGPESL